MKNQLTNYVRLKHFNEMHFKIKRSVLKLFSVIFCELFSFVLLSTTFDFKIERLIVIIIITR